MSMNQNPWNRPLPLEIVLGGEKRFTRPLPDPTQSWVVIGGAAPAAALRVKSRFADHLDEISLQARYCEGLLEGNSPGNFPQPPTLDQMSWDWIEYHYQPLRDLEVEVINWVPDPRVICGKHTIQNNGSQTREITLELTCQDEMGIPGIHLATETFQGRLILSGRSNRQNLLLFLAGSRNLPAAPSNQLTATSTLEPMGRTEIRWILICCDSDCEMHKYLDAVIKLDWEGEIARRKIALSSQLQIKTGNADRDFSLAFSQRQARLILHQQILQAENGLKRDFPLRPFPAWQLYLALAPLETPPLEQLLRTACGENLEEGPSFPIAAELLWQAQKAGVSPDLLQKFLPAVEGNLQAWFSILHDKDQDGIPEEPGGNLFQLDRYNPQDNSYGIDPYQNDETLETPGLAALLHNEICQLEKLREMAPGPLEFSKRKKKLEEFILDSWQDDESRFQTRDYRTHLSKKGYSVPGPIQNGWNILRLKLPYPSRLILQVPRASDNHLPGDLRVALQGTDWQGRYRIEVLDSRNILRSENGGWGATETLFSELDYCVVVGLEGTQNINLVTHGADRQDLSLTLPLWFTDLPPEIGERMITTSLAESADFWSAYGLKSYPLPGNSPVQLPLNLLVCQGLIKSGHCRQAGDLFKRWTDVISLNLAQTGRLYSSWESKTGTSRGKGNLLESTLPIGLLLELLGVRFLVSGNLILEERDPVLFPVQLIYRGTEITLEEKETLVCRPGGDMITLPRGKKAVIQL